MPSLARGQTERDGGDNGDDGDSGDGADDRTVRMARATWDTGWFQAEIFRQLFQSLGYRVEGPRTYENVDFYRDVARGDVDLWVNGWFPLHRTYDTDWEAIDVLGYEVAGGARQGYLVDRATAERLGVASLEDFERSEVARAFDRDGDGLADLIGCSRGWGCEPQVKEHLERLALNDHVTHVQGDYAMLMLDVVERFKSGESVFFYTWTPNWTVGELVPGEDVVWLEVPSKELESAESCVDQVDGCAGSPCCLGFAPNDIRTVANRAFLRDHPAIRTLLSSVSIPLEDISWQNAKLLDGEDEASDFSRHAAEWIAEHRGQVDLWLQAARASAGMHSAATEAGVASHPVGPSERANSVELRGADLPRSRLRIVTKPLAPFVEYDALDQAYSGFSIELWRRIAREAELDFEIHAVTSVAKLLDEVERGAADAAIAGIGITSRREQVLNFSHPYFESGLQILVPADAGGPWGRSLFGMVRGLFSTQLLSVFGILLAALLAAAHVIWLAERRSNSEEFSEGYVRGIWEALWWAAVTATTVGYGDKTPKSTVGRLVGLVWIFSGLFVLAYFTAGVAATFALNEAEGKIQSPQDLFGKDVATIRRSTAADYLSRQGIEARLFDREADAYEALLANDVQAMVYDAPVVQHYAANQGKGEVRTAGLVFRKINYGIALPPSSPYRESINLALLRLIEKKEYQRLYRRYFGEAR